MKKALKVILISIVCLCLLVIIGGYIALTQIDFNNYKTMISKSVFDATGRELVVGKLVALSLLSAISAVVYSVSMIAAMPMMMNMALFISRSPIALFLSLGDMAFSSSILEGFLTFS